MKNSELIAYRISMIIIIMIIIGLFIYIKQDIGLPKTCGIYITVFTVVGLFRYSIKLS